MLLALLDPGEEAMDVSDGAAATIEKCELPHVQPLKRSPLTSPCSVVKSINKRLSALQRRVGSQDAGSV